MLILCIVQHCILEPDRLSSSFTGPQIEGFVLDWITLKTHLNLICLIYKLKFEELWNFDKFGT